jgi:predicted GNAT superfamily acetyltransferase
VDQAKSPNLKFPNPKSIMVRPIQTIEEYRAVEGLQRDVWGLDDVEIVPDHVLLTAQKNGGMVLGAFHVAPDGGEAERLVGFVFGFVGLTPDGRPKHCSHIAGVAPAYQNQNVGHRLKLAQRHYVLSQGLDLVTWTFDPLESRNARLNFHKLGVTCDTYVRDLYGSMRDELNVGLPSDRFQVDWHVASAHVADRLGAGWTGPSLSALQAGGVPVVNRVLPGGGTLPRPSQVVLPFEGERLLVQIPARFQAVKSADLGLALAWREQTRSIFETAFVQGYVAIDLLFEAGQSYYLLRKDRTPDENRTR